VPRCLGAVLRLERRQAETLLHLDRVARHLRPPRYRDEALRTIRRPRRNVYEDG
jgi:hypothetical protein